MHRGFESLSHRREHFENFNVRPQAAEKTTSTVALEASRYFPQKAVAFCGKLEVMVVKGIWLLGYFVENSK